MTGWQKYWLGTLVAAVLFSIMLQHWFAAVPIVVLALMLAFFGLLMKPARLAVETRSEAATRTAGTGPASKTSRTAADSAGNWLTPEQKADLFVDASSDSVPVELRQGPRGVYLTDPATGLQMPADGRYAPKADLWGVNARGADHYANNAAGIHVGAQVRLEREPDNEHDPNAVAIQWQGRTVGYYNRGMAKRLTARGDGDLRAVVIGKGPLRVLAAPVVVWDQIGEP